MLKVFQLSGLHTNYTPERKSKQCFRQVHDVVQKQQTFDARAGGTKIEAGEERRDQAVMGAVLRLSSNVRAASPAVSSPRFQVQNGSEGAGEAEGAVWSKPIPKHPGEGRGHCSFQGGEKETCLPQSKSFPGPCD
ncbi:Hypothetical predicted protein [Lynx pardinus]|uniref:Uncharacterized protein n=1 Tax=Lynx pardinus TaxID=191816 RepID=A0A485N6R7_LYNPA|nr:Hypothetical predicted protein [Lynx pardinus]